MSLLAMSAFLIISYMFAFEWLAVGMVLSGLMLLVIIPLYQFYQSAKIERQMKILYRERNQAITEDSQIFQPVYIYLYINKHTEEMLSDIDYSKYR